MDHPADGHDHGAEPRPAADVAAASRILALERLVEEYRVLLETSAALTASMDLPVTLQVIARLVTQHLDVAWCDLFEYDTVGDEFVVVAYYQLPELEIDSSSWAGTSYGPENWAGLQSCIASKEPCIWYRDDPDLPEEEMRHMDEWGERSSMALPLMYRSGIVGLIDVGESRHMRRWSEDDRRVLKAIADQAAIAMVNAKASQRLTEQAVTDDLTGLCNHRHFQEHLAVQVATARRYGQELSLLIVDVDDFKAFNDQFGHPNGDKVLVELAGILGGITRTDVDVVARHGGDEFVVILPQARAAGPEPTAARNVAERIRGVLTEHRFEGLDGRRDQAVTVSVGVAGIGIGGYTAEELQNSADKALYLAKHQGKDRVIVFGT
jgi:diguanylate cyclase (GGDEF)-like protein